MEQYKGSAEMIENELNHLREYFFHHNHAMRMKDAYETAYTIARLERRLHNHKLGNDLTLKGRELSIVYAAFDSERERLHHVEHQRRGDWRVMQRGTVTPKSWARESVENWYRHCSKFRKSSIAQPDILAKIVRGEYVTPIGLR